MGNTHEKSAQSATSPMYSSSTVSDAVIPILIMGDEKTGKSCLIHRFVSGEYSEAMAAEDLILDGLRKRIAIDNRPQTIDISDELTGENFYESLLASGIRKAEAFIIVYSVDSKESFEKVNQKLDTIYRVTEGTSAPIILAANKTDLDKSAWQVSSEEGKALASKLNMAEYIEVSAKANTNVTKLFETTASMAVRKRNQSQSAPK